ncbi:MAG: LPS assembly lipoprotein LptE [Chitinophagales bacterium]
MKQLSIISNVLLICTLLLQVSCGIYSFTGTSIDPQVKTFFVDNLPNLATTVNPNLSQTLVEKMKDKFTSDARLDIASNTGDVEFSGNILNYLVEPAASSANDEAALSRLSITVRIEFVNNVTDETWMQNFTHYENFDRNVNLSDVEDTLVDEITERLVTDIFTKAFSNW